MEIMTVIGGLLDGSGWMHVLTKSGMCGYGTADTFLKCSNVKKTRYAHQVTVACLSMLQQEGYERSVQGAVQQSDFEEWRQ